MGLILSRRRGKERESHARARLASREERSSGLWPITPANRPPLIGQEQPAPVVLIKRRGEGRRWLDGVRAGALIERDHAGTPDRRAGSPARCGGAERRGSEIWLARDWDVIVE
jgi:hypothetical protein